MPPMTRESNLPLDRIRARSGELPNHLIDELSAGRLDRREFLRRASVAGLSASAAGVILAACGGANSTGASKSSTSASGPAKAGGTLRVAQQAPAAAVNPLTVADAGGLNLLAQTGEYLVFDNDATLSLEPMLATKWSSNHDGSVWTFTLRQGVKFHTGKTMAADDVVWVFKQLSDPHNASNALSNFGGVLLPEGRPQSRRHDRGVPPAGGQRELPVPGQLRQPQRDHRPRRDRLRRPRSSARVRSSSPASRRPPALRSFPTLTTGARRRCWPRPRSTSTPANSRRCWRWRAATST